MSIIIYAIIQYQGLETEVSERKLMSEEFVLFFFLRPEFNLNLSEARGLGPLCFSFVISN